MGITYKNKWWSNLFSKLFHTDEKTELIEESTKLDFSELNEEKEEPLEVIKLNNSIVKRLKNLESYIGIFKNNFPEQYNSYLLKIREQLDEYDLELSKYKDSYENHKIAFTVDPEFEMNKLNALTSLENEINIFIENDVKFKSWKIRLSEFCYKLNQLYNLSMVTSDSVGVLKQVGMATVNLEKILLELKDEHFFINDIRKKTEITEYIFYSNYIIFKLNLRFNQVYSFSDFKEKATIDDFFTVYEYDKSVLKFLVDELKSIQEYIKFELRGSTMYKVALEKYEKLQTMYINSENIQDDIEYFQKIIENENVLQTFIKAEDKNFKIPISSIIDITDFKAKSNIISVKAYALVVLELITDKKTSVSAEIVNKIIYKLSDDMTYREFFFLCKIFELNADIEQISNEMNFEKIKYFFRKLEDEYEQYYSDSKIREKKQIVLKKKDVTENKYARLFEIEENELGKFSKELNNLLLDYFISNGEIYINCIYFKGFENIEKIYY